MKKCIFLISIVMLFIVMTTGCDNSQVSGILTPTAKPVGQFSVSGKASFGTLPLPEVTLRLVDDEGSAVSVDSDLSGNFTFADVPTGFYNLIPEKTGWASSDSYFVYVSDKNITARNFVSSAANGYIVDPWGYVWDATPRAAKTWAEANAICTSLGGRLPTATEIYRNSAGKGTGTLVSGITEIDTAWMWTNIQWDVGLMTLGKVNDGAVTNTAPTNAYKFRCVYPSIIHTAFKGNNVYGPPGDEGYRVNINGKRYIIDKYDRAPLPYSAAVRECAFYHGMLPTEEVLSGLIQEGLPNGSNSWIWIADQTGYNGTNFMATIARWTGTNTAFNDTYSTYVTNSYFYDARGFRCIGIDTDWEASPKVLDLNTEFIEPSLRIKTTTINEAATTYINALKICFNRGGHLPTHQDMIFLVMAGLSGGTNENMWTSDFTGGNNVTVVHWLSVDTAFTGYYSAYMTWAGHTTEANKYRCVYYPIDPNYNGPDLPISELFSIEKDLGNGKKLKIWVDMADRAPSEFYLAVKACHALGGRLTSRRDLVEAIVTGLPNGSGEWLWTSDRDGYDSFDVIKWSGTGNSSYNDTEGTNATALSPAVANKKPYRCYWTNELR